MLEPSCENQFLSAHCQLLLTSFQRLLERPLLARASTKDLYHAKFPILSHNTAADPILTYGNLAAQNLWEMQWEELTALPSRLTAEPAHRDTRDAMFAEMRSKGFIENYSGVRISASGMRFEIRNAVIWSLLNSQGKKVGEAATFQDFEFL